MQNKPNFRNAEMNARYVLTNHYEDIYPRRRLENKPNSKPIQTQYDPKQSQFKPNMDPKQTQIKPNMNPKQTQSNPISKGPPTLLCGALSVGNVARKDFLGGLLKSYRISQRSIAAAAWRPLSIARTTREAPLIASPAANTQGSLV